MTPSVARSEDLQDTVRFEARATPSSDGAGNEVTGAWTTKFTRRAKIIPLKGGEDVLAARLSARQPIVVIVRDDPETRTIVSSWRLVDVSSGAIYNIRTAVDMERRHQFLTLMCEGGVAI